MIPHRTSAVTPNAGSGRNAPNVTNRLSIVVDVTKVAIDDARAAGLHGIADELDTVRARVATLALRLWWTEGGNR